MSAMDVRGSNRTFEEYDAALEWSRAADVDTVKIVVPGFKREEIRVLVDNHGHLRARGERLVAVNKWSLFQKEFQLPADCLVNSIRAKFENDTLTITLPKKNPSPSQVAPPPAPPVPEPRRPAMALSEPAKEPSPPPRAPVLHPAPSQKPVAERRLSLPRKPLTPEAPPMPAPAPEETTQTLPSPQAAAEEKERSMEREARGKMEEDMKMVEEKQKEAKRWEEEEEEMDMAQRRRPVSNGRALVVNIALVAVVLVGITVYVLRALIGGDGELGSGSHGDEM